MIGTAVGSVRAAVHRALRIVRTVVGFVTRIVRTVMGIVTRPLDWAGHLAAPLWRSMFGTASALCVFAGVLHALGREDDAYSSMIVAGALGAVGTFFALLALRVEPDTSTDPETSP